MRTIRSKLPHIYVSDGGIGAGANTMPSLETRRSSTPNGETFNDSLRIPQRRVLNRSKFLD